MLKRFGIPSLALATLMAVAAPTITLARDRDDRGGGRDFDRHDVVRDRDHDRRSDRDDRFHFGVGVYTAPAPVIAPAPVPAPAAGYYDQYGVWHPYEYYGY